MTPAPLQEAPLQEAPFPNPIDEYLATFRKEGEVLIHHGCNTYRIRSTSLTRISGHPQVQYKHANGEWRTVEIYAVQILLGEVMMESCVATLVNAILAGRQVRDMRCGMHIANSTIRP